MRKETIEQEYDIHNLNTRLIKLFRKNVQLILEAAEYLDRRAEEHGYACTPLSSPEPSPSPFNNHQQQNQHFKFFHNQSSALTYSSYSSSYSSSYDSSYDNFMNSSGSSKFVNKKNNNYFSNNNIYVDSINNRNNYGSSNNKGSSKTKKKKNSKLRKNSTSKLVATLHFSHLSFL
ncbi:hypothetical protein HELRODRAFT_167435 [Helobdella robusta]|uniref:Uncharacterized protein n=1 Tax=Helobdella robusta TaxID=6412 RepID=T1EZD3_HELRO|nr:hypothetical protein HELRODRAFT_167435 [Helobdella robusta]ESO10919.1 hypothetical protein HELRODRAFT_167435 [Helobdella robusta]